MPGRSRTDQLMKTQRSPDAVILHPGTFFFPDGLGRQNEPDADRSVRRRIGNAVSARYFPSR